MWDKSRHWLRQADRRVLRWCAEHPHAVVVAVGVALLPTGWYWR